jgi:hypothetical protein
MDRNSKIPNTNAVSINLLSLTFRCSKGMAPGVCGMGRKTPTSVIRHRAENEPGSALRDKAQHTLMALRNIRSLEHSSGAYVFT